MGLTPGKLSRRDTGMTATHAVVVRLVRLVVETGSLTGKPHSLLPERFRCQLFDSLDCDYRYHSLLQFPSQLVSRMRCSRPGEAVLQLPPRHLQQSSRHCWRKTRVAEPYVRLLV